MNTRATGAIKAPEILEAMHLPSPGAQIEDEDDEADEDPWPGSTVLPLQSTK